jgi:ubiquinone/menaquinone biosynthesis C-methylase UbiE
VNETTPHLSLEEIKDYWKEQACRYGQSPAASWSDREVIEMEIREISQYLNDGERVLDIGCANGYSTIQYAAQKKSHFKGVDFIPEMIEQAIVRCSSHASLAGTLEFEIGDLTALSEADQAYDKVITTRVLINLGSRERQRLALHQCARVLRNNGKLLLSEATVQGWQQLNGFRKEWALPEIPMPAFNLYLDENELGEMVRDVFDIEAVVNFASTYYVGTRILKPLLIRALGASIDVADPNMHWNRWFAQVPAAGNYGTQKLFVMRRVHR